jgi:hypothetical protein
LILPPVGSGGKVDVSTQSWWAPTD